MTGTGMTGTAMTEAGEFFEIYKLDVVEIPTNRPISRDDKEDLIYKTTVSSPMGGMMKHNYSYS